MSNFQHKIGCALLLVFCLVSIPPPSSGFGMLKGGGGGNSAVAEILAAGLITGLLLDQSPPMARPLFRSIMHPMMEYMMPMPPQRHMHAMMANNMPMMHPYAMASLRQPQYLMNQALMAQASQQQAIAVRLNEEIRALEAQESLLEAYLARNQQGTNREQSSIRELLREEADAIPAAAFILETADIMEQENNMHRPQARPHQDVFEAAGSEPESRYILPRIVRHFVQRLIRRAEHH